MTDIVLAQATVLEWDVYEQGGETHEAFCARVENEAKDILHFKDLKDEDRNALFKALADKKTISVVLKVEDTEAEQ